MCHNHPLVSILIPSYNHRPYVTQTLQSILDDGYPNKEVIIVDDGSTDGSDEAIREWLSAHPLDADYTHRPNRGLPATLNELLTKSRGEFIVLLASDDLLLEGGIASRVAFLQKHPKLQAVFADCIVIDGEGKKICESGLFDYRKNEKEDFADAERIKKAFIRRFAMPGPVLMTRRSYYLRNGQYDESLMMEDFAFYLRIAAQEQIGFLDTKVSAYRIHDTNMSRSLDKGRFIRLLKDGRRVLLKQAPLFSLRYRPLIWWQVLKFSIRIVLYRYDIMK